MLFRSGIHRNLTEPHRPISARRHRLTAQRPRRPNSMTRIRRFRKSTPHARDSPRWRFQMRKKEPSSVRGFPFSLVAGAALLTPISHLQKDLRSRLRPAAARQKQPETAAPSAPLSSPAGAPASVDQQSRRPGPVSLSSAFGPSLVPW